MSGGSSETQLYQKRLRKLYWMQYFIIGLGMGVFSVGMAFLLKRLRTQSVN